MSSQLINNLGRGALGMAFLIFVCYLLSTNRRAISWKLVFFGIFAQVMFAMGVLHTTIYGQPIFWILFGLILIYTVIRKFSERNREDKIFTYDTRDVLLVLASQFLLIFGLLLAPQVLRNWSGLSMVISGVTILIILFKVGNRHPELMKWSILVSSSIICGLIYAKICPPDLFRLILQSSSNVFVELI